MTQKELLYVEDAIGHENSIIKIIEESLNNLEDEELISFFEQEINIHSILKQNLFELLEEKVNE